MTSFSSRASQLERSRIWSASALQIGLWLGLFGLCVGVLVQTAGTLLDPDEPLATVDAATRASIISGIAELGISLQTFVRYSVAIDLLAKASAAAIGALLIARAKADWFIALLAYIILAYTAATYPPDIPTAMDHDPFWTFVARSTTLLAISVFFVIPFLFPNGRFVPVWTVVPMTLAVASAGFFIWDTPALLPPRAPSAAVEFALTGTVFGSALLGQFYRYRRVATAREREQTKWVVFGIAIALPAFVVGDALLRTRWDGLTGGIALLAFPVVINAAFLVIPSTIAVAVLRHRLFDIDVVISRTLAWALTSTLVVGCYVAIVLGLGSLLHAPGSMPLSVIATGLVAIGFQPARSAIQRRVNRALFGDRDEPYVVVSRLGSRMAGTLRPDELLPSIVHTLTDALRVPYAAIYLQAPAGLELAASNGTAVPHVASFPLVHQSERVGELRVAPRTSAESFGRHDLRVLGELAGQIGVAAHAARLTTDLQRSRERIVIAREEERQRLRRDLHDGLGTHLAALAVRANVLRGQIARDPAAAEQSAIELRTELKRSISSIRQLVQGLRPPALDELGLLGSLRTLGERFRFVDAAVDQPIAIVEWRLQPLPPLPAAVEVAIYRIVEEALTNVQKHAKASQCTVSLDMRDEGTVSLSIIDDGTAVDPSPDLAGFGLISMRERAEEVGGSFRIAPCTDGRGTRIDVRLPISPSASSTS